MGLEKRAYALTEADFALWLASENEWRMRLAATPLRTDTNVSDTGDIKLSGSIRRGARLSDTPLSLQVVLEQAQLGQLSKLVYGRDRGWRGAVTVSAALSGTPARLAVVGDASVDDFRRYDIAGGGSVRLRTHCSAQINLPEQRLSNLACFSPIGAGSVSVQGQLSGVPHPSAYSLTVAAENLPAAAVVALARHMKKDLPEDLSASGTVDMAFDLRRGQPEQPDAWAGAATTSDLQIRSGMLGEPLRLGQLRFSLAEPGGAPKATHVGRTRTKLQPPAQEMAINVAPLAVAMGGPAPATAQASFTRSGYDIGLQGDAQLKRLMQLARAAGLPAPTPAITGTAKLNLNIAGNWTGFAAPAITGSAQLRGVTAQVNGLAEPLQLTSANVTLSPAELAFSNVAAGFPALHLSFTGALQAARGCLTSDVCSLQVQLQSEQIATDDLNRLLNPKLRPRPWYDLIGSSSSPALPLARVQARGTLSASRLLLHSLPAKNVRAEMQWQNGVLKLSGVQGEVLGGKHSGALRADFSGDRPSYTLQGSIERLALDQLASLMRDKWASGYANTSYQVTTSGWDAAEMLASATGSLSFDWRNGALPHLTLARGASPLRVRHFAGQISLHNRMLTISQGKLDTPEGSYAVSGTASFGRELQLLLTRDSQHAYTVTGTMERPRVAAVERPETRAALQP